MPLQAVVRQCKNVHSLHIFYFVKGVKYSTDGSILIKQKVFSIRHRYNAVANGCSAVRQANYLHNLYFIKSVSCRVKISRGDKIRQGIFKTLLTNAVIKNKILR